MKRAVLCCVLVLAVTAAAADEKKTTKTTTTTTSKSSDKDEAIKKMERELWDAWKNHDAKPFETNISDDGLALDDPSKGFQDKPAMLKNMSTGACDVKSYSFGDEKMTWIDKDAVIYTYTADMDATCGGQKLPGKVYAGSVWAKRGGKWVAVFHQESAAMPPSM